jgi:hypothetical protein
MKGEGPMEEQQQPEIKVPDLLESPLESEETAGQDEVQTMKPVKVKLVDYPPGFKSQFKVGKGFQVNGEVFEVYEAKEPKNGRPRFLIRGIGILGIVEEPLLQETEKVVP